MVFISFHSLLYRIRRISLELHNVSDQCSHMVCKFLFCYFSFIFKTGQSLSVQSGVDIKGKVEAIEDVSVNLCEKLCVGEQVYSPADAADSLREAFVVDFTHNFHYWLLSCIDVNAGEDELEKIQNTGAIVTAGEVLEKDIRARQVILKITLVPE